MRAWLVVGARTPEYNNFSNRLRLQLEQQVYLLRLSFASSNATSVSLTLERVFVAQTQAKMPRASFSRSVATQIASALEANLTPTFEPTAAQLWNAARPRMISTIARAEGSSLLRNVARGSGSSSVLKPCTCGKVMCPGHARSMSTASSAPHVQPAWATDARAPGLAERLAEVTKALPHVPVRG